jgi:hypothetical protein
VTKALAKTVVFINAAAMVLAARNGDTTAFAIAWLSATIGGFTWLLCKEGKL